MTRMEILANFCIWAGFVTAVIAALLGVLSHFYGCIWTSGAAAIIGIVGFCAWLHGSHATKESAPVRESAGKNERPSSPKPRVRDKEPSPAQKATSPLPSKILDEVNNARPLQRPEVIRSFVGAPVDWILVLADAQERIGEDKYDVFFKEPGKFSHLGLSAVHVRISKTGNEYLKLVSAGEQFRVSGTILNVELIVIHLENASITRAQ